MDIRMIAVDLDGTLLHDDKTVSAYTVDVLRRCQARGIAVTFATARAPRVALRFAGVINPDAASYHNGARVVGFDGTQTYNALTGAQAMEIMRIVCEYRPEEKFALELDGEMRANFDMSFVRGCEDYVPDDFSHTPEGRVYNVLLKRVEPGDIERIADMLPEYAMIRPCESTMALIIPRGADKFEGVKRMAESGGIPLENVAAFGDDMTDVEMIRGCGVGVAMANSKPGVLARVKHTCASNQQDGVARWIAHNVLGEE